VDLVPEKRAIPVIMDKKEMEGIILSHSAKIYAKMNYLLIMEN